MTKRPAKKAVVDEGLPENKRLSSPPPSALTDRDTRKKVINFISRILVVLFILIAVVWGRAYYSQQKFFKEGERALDVQNYKDAVTGYEWTIRMYTPFSSKVETACQRLWDIGLEYEKRGRFDWALITYRSLRSSIYAIRSFYTPYKEWIPKTDSKIELILAAKKMQERRESVKTGKNNGLLAREKGSIEP